MGIKILNIHDIEKILGGYTEYSSLMLVNNGRENYAV